MKKLLSGITILLVALCIIVFLDIYFDPSGNAKLELNEILAKFKPTVYLNFAFNANEIGKVEFQGMSVSDFTNQQKIEKLISYLNDISLAKAKRVELPNRSSDAQVTFYDVHGKKLIAYAIYGQVFIEDLNTNQLYRSKKVWIIEGVENLNLDFD